MHKDIEFFKSHMKEDLNATFTEKNVDKSIDYITKNTYLNEEGALKLVYANKDTFKKLVDILKLKKEEPKIDKYEELLGAVNPRPSTREPYGSSPSGALSVMEGEVGY